MLTAKTTLTAMWLDASGFITFSKGYTVTDNTYKGKNRDYVGFRFDINMNNKISKSYSTVYSTV